MTAFLTLLGALLALAFLAVLILYLRALGAILELIGDPNGALAAVAAEQDALAARTEPLESELTRLNGSLSASTDGLVSINGLLAATVATVQRQGGTP